MADIFVSYSRGDKPRVAPLVAALEAVGWSVWWDMALAPGEEFDQVTGTALESARCVVVVWTPTSVTSRWVRGEARVGADRNVLVPVRFEGATPPIDLRAIQTVDLDDWGGDVKSGAFRVVQQSLTAMLGAPSKAGAPCVGRKRELDRLREYLARAERGEGGCILVSGEAGIGKTRLTREAESLARDAGFQVLRGHCTNMGAAPPYQPAIEQIEQISRQLGPEMLRRSMGENAPEICRLMPELLQRYSDIPDYPSLPPEQERRYLLHGLAEFVARGSARQPLLLVFEDLHWAEESTCILLAYMAERLKRERILVVVTYRDGDLSAGAPFARTLHELIRQNLAEELRLQRLARADIAELLMRLFSAAPPANLVELLFARTEGNPFFVDEVVRHMRDGGKLIASNGAFNETIADSDAGLTSAARLIVEQRINRLGPRRREVLTIAAVAGRVFDFDLLVRVDGAQSEDEVLDAVEEAERRQLIEDVSSGRVARYRFVHEQICETLVAGLSSPRRQRLHLRLADALEAAGPGAAVRSVGEIAHHLHEAGRAADAGRTVRFLMAAGERDLRALAFEDGLKQFDRALMVLDDGGDASLRMRLYLMRGEALRGAERIPEALDALARAGACAPSEPERDEVRLKRCLLLLDLWRGGEALADLENLLAGAMRAGDVQRELDVQRVLARAYYVMSLDHSDYAHKCRDAYERTIDLARRLGDRAALGAALVAAANLADYWPTYREQSRDNLAEAGRIAEEIADSDLALDVATARLGLLPSERAPSDEEGLLQRLLARRDPIRLNNHYFRMMWSTLSSGRLERCLEVCDAGIELAYRIGALPVQYPTIKSFALLDLGRFDEAWSCLEQEIADEAHRFGAALREMGRMLFEIRLGDVAGALDRAPHVIAEAHTLVRAWMLQTISVELACLAPLCAEDKKTLARIVSLFDATGVGPRAIAQGGLALAHGDVHAARAHLSAEDAYPVMRAVRVRLSRFSLLARANRDAGDLAGACTAIEAGVELARAKGVRSWLWRLLAEQSQLEAEAGRAVNAAACLASAHAIWRDLAAAISDPARRTIFLRNHVAVGLGLSE